MISINNSGVSLGTCPFIFRPGISLNLDVRNRFIAIVMFQVAQLQNLARRLLAAGYAKNQSAKEQYLLYVDPDESFLQCQILSSNSSPVDQELVASSVRPNSTAAYLIAPTGKLIICITPSSALSAYTYNQDDCEWVEAALPDFVTHANGKLAGSVDANGRIHVVFQNPSQCLIYLDNSWSGKILPVSPVVGSPLSISVVGNTLHVYYISAKDNFIHDVTGANDNWKDRIVIKHKFDQKIKNFTVVKSESGDEELYVMTEDDALLKINAQGRQMKLGTVKMGKFISERSVDDCANDAWNGTLNEDRLTRYIRDDPSCIDIPGGDQSVTPLAAACMTGRLDVVQLLLRSHANPNALSLKKRTPLFYATSTQQDRDRAAIVRALLEAGANVDECYFENGFNTPLMNAIILTSNLDVVNELLKHGASTTAKDVTGQTVEMIAKGSPMGEELSQRIEEGKWSPLEKKLIEFVVTLIMFIVAYTNSPRFKDLVDKIFIKLKETYEVKDEKTFAG